METVRKIRSWLGVAACLLCAAALVAAYAAVFGLKPERPKGPIESWVFAKKAPPAETAREPEPKLEPKEPERQKPAPELPPESVQEQQPTPKQPVPKQPAIPAWANDPNWVAPPRPGGRSHLPGVGSPSVMEILHDNNQAAVLAPGAAFGRAKLLREQVAPLRSELVRLLNKHEPALKEPKVAAALKKCHELIERFDKFDKAVCDDIKAVQRDAARVVPGPPPSPSRWTNDLKRMTAMVDAIKAAIAEFDREGNTAAKAKK